MEGAKNQYRSALEYAIIGDDPKDKFMAMSDLINFYLEKPGQGEIEAINYRLNVGKAGNILDVIDDQFKKNLPLEESSQPSLFKALFLLLRAKVHIHKGRVPDVASNDIYQAGRHCEALLNTNPGDILAQETKAEFLEVDALRQEVNGNYSLAGGLLKNAFEIYQSFPDKRKAGRTALHLAELVLKQEAVNLNLAMRYCNEAVFISEENEIYGRGRDAIIHTAAVKLQEEIRSKQIAKLGPS